MYNIHVRFVTSLTLSYLVFPLCRWDESDLDSGIDFTIRSSSPELILAGSTPRESTEPLQPPSPAKYCGTVYGIIFIELTGDAQNERLKHNNFDGDLITLKCNPSGKKKIALIRLTGYEF